MLNQPPKDRMLKPRDVMTREGKRSPLAVFPKPQMSPETPGYEEYLRRQSQPRKK